MVGNSQPLQLFGDFGFPGGEDTAPNPLQDNQTCINWYAEVNKQNAKEVVGLLATPGLVQLVAAPGGGVGGGGSAGTPSVALLHFDGVNNGTVFTDVYFNNWAIGSGSPITETGTVKFGSAAFSAGGGFINSASAPFVLGSGDFTIEIWFYPTSVSSFYGIYAKRATSTNTASAALNIDTGGGGRLHGSVSNTLGSGSWALDLFSGTLVLNTWHHAALVRFGNTFTLYLDGVSQATGTLSGALSDDGNGPVIGALAQNGAIPFAGFLDEFRFSKVARYTANFTPQTAAFTETPPPGFSYLTKIWENTATGFHFSSFNNESFLDGFPNGTARATKRPLTPAINSNDGNVYCVSMATGATLANDVPNAFESSISSNGLAGAGIGNVFKDPSNNSMALVMPHIGKTIGVFSSHIADSSPTGNIQLSPQGSTGTGANLYCCQYSNAAIVGDVLSVITKPSGLTGTWRLVGAFPCADWQHVACITKDSGGTGNFWLHVVAISASGFPTNLAIYPFTSATDGDQAASLTNAGGVPGSWVDPVFDRAVNSMLESNLITMWTSDLSSGFQTARYFKVGSNGQITQTAQLPYSANHGVGWASIYADNGVMVYYADNFAHSVVATTIPTPPAVTAWPTPSTVINLPVRGLWELPNNVQALAVIGNICFLVTLATPATATAFATLALTQVGTLQTSIGPVHIRDNDVGGYAVIVDGPYGYLYNISTQVFTQITDPAFLGADTVAFIDGWWVFNQPGTQTFYTNFPQYGTGFNASFFALKDGAPDNLRAVFENKEQLWLLGDKTTEVWYDAGGQYFAFQRLVGTLMQFGCKAAHSVARFSTQGQDGVILFGRSERGENVIIKTQGFSFEVVSTPAFSKEVAQYPITSDAIAYTYQEDTHEFYVLIFPTADTTWCYDAQSGLLHKRLSYDPYLQQFHRHRSNCFMNFQGMRIVGDYQNGALYQLTRNVQTDAGWPILARRRSPHIWDKSQRGRTFMASVQADFRPGVGIASGLGSNPQAKLRISRDGGTTFGQQWPSPIGQIGQYKTRTMWRKLAFGRDNVIELEVIDPVPRDLIGVTLKAFSSA